MIGDAETVQSKVQGAGGDRGDSGREDAEPIGVAFWGSPGADCALAPGGAGATGRGIRGWTAAEGWSWTGLKKSWLARVRIDEGGWSLGRAAGACVGSASCWA